MIPNDLTGAVPNPEQTPPPADPMAGIDQGQVYEPQKVAGLGWGALKGVLGGAKRLEDVRKSAGRSERIDAAGMSDEAIPDTDEFLKKVDDAYDRDAKAAGRTWNINWNYIQTPDDVKDVIAQAANQLDDPRQVISNDMTIQFAKDMGLGERQILKWTEKNGISARQLTAARSILLDSGVRIRQAAKLIKAGDNSDANMVAFKQLLTRHAGLQFQVSGMTAEAGRALQAMKIPASEGTIRAEHIADILNVSGGRASAEKMVDMVLELDDSAKLGRFIRKAHKAGPISQLYEYWINALLSSPKTHAVNIASNAFVAMFSVPERAVGAAVGATRTIGRGGDRVRMGEPIAQSYGLLRGMQDGIRLAARAFKSGEPSDPMTKIENDAVKAIQAKNWGVSDESAIGMSINFLGGVVRTPGRALLAEDEFFKSVGYRMELHSLAYRNAVQEATEQGQDSAWAAARAQHLVNDPTAELHKAATEQARKQTFTAYAGWMEEVGRAVRKFPPMKLIIPFVRTPANIARFIMQRMPVVNAIDPQIRDDFMAGGAKRDMVIAKMTTGSAVFATAWQMAQSGMITGGGPGIDEMGNKDAMYRKGWQPYSLVAYDENGQPTSYHQINRLDPLGGMLGMVADVSDKLKYVDEESPEFQDFALAAVTAIAKNMGSKTYMEGINNMMRAYDSPDRFLDSWAQNMAGTAIPRIVADVRNQQDPTMREVYSLWEAVESQTPGLSKDLPPKRNLFGYPIVLERSLGNPANKTTPKNESFSKIDEEIIANRMDIRMPSKVLSGVEMTPQEYDRYVELAGNVVTDSAGNNMIDTLNKMVASEQYQAASGGPDGLKRTLIQSVVTAYREMAKVQLREESPKLGELLADKEKNPYPDGGNNLEVYF